jgi:hypothetical protein
MTSSRNAGALIASGSSGFGTVHADRFALTDLDPRPPQSRGSSELTTMGRADRSLVVYAEKPPRILLVDAAIALHELHLVLLRSIPAIVESSASSTDMYLHKEHAYALVILVFPPKSRETTEAADYVRHRWSAARILLLENESAMIDDWLYDERIDRHLHPTTLRKAAIRLMVGEEYWIPALIRS